MDIAERFAENACRNSYAALPVPVVAATKRLILDTIGAGFAGSSADAIDAGLALVREAGGAPQAGVIVFGDRLPATSAAMINGAMCQARDFDPVYEPGVMLPYGPIVAAALAAAEIAGSTGKEFIHAVVLGSDMACRLGKSMMTGLGWSRTATLGVFGAALASARLMRLDRDRTVSALGLAYSQSSGNIQSVIDGSHAKRYQGGFAAAAGLKAALLAARGVTGPHNIFEGRCGFFTVYESGKVRKEMVTEGLGEIYEGTAASVKPYPCSREHHGAVAAALRLHAEGVRAADIESLTLRLTPNAFVLSGKAFRRGASHSIGDAISSAAYGAAVALVQGHVTLGDFQKEALSDARVLDLADRTEIQEDRGISDAKTLVPQAASVKLRGGAVREAVVTAMPGSPESPLSPRELKEKFQACLAHSARPVPSKQADALADSVENLESLSSIGELKIHVP
ncbi:MAG: hypothetical protein A3G27_12955 [Betaproteobacteria bacterium RIFCSPLOWO2_12_FULL_66_14]|nr:MAG: hypothetical protein A3G27_12955 [Betaproteobacteria bacterium RIFCSPLOWO2_12_FULL_66_14]